MHFRFGILLTLCTPINLTCLRTYIVRLVLIRFSEVTKLTTQANELQCASSVLVVKMIAY